jgi:hypothetical protein
MKGIYVERLIHADIERIWEFTQNPCLHQRWDLRFSKIAYLPRATPVEPQKFSYETRIGFGLKVCGEGESLGEVAGDNSSRTSKLKFWSDDAKSLIRSGSGYWRYIPTSRGVRFLTYYDYSTRFGFLGRFVDLAFRPLIGWATARSFDALALWLEQGVEPERAGLRPRASRCLRRPPA